MLPNQNKGGYGIRPYKSQIKSWTHHLGEIQRDVSNFIDVIRYTLIRYLFVTNHTNVLDSLYLLPITNISTRL